MVFILTLEFTYFLFTASNEYFKAGKAPCNVYIVISMSLCWEPNDMGYDGRGSAGYSVALPD